MLLLACRKADPSFPTSNIQTAAKEFDNAEGIRTLPNENFMSNEKHKRIIRWTRLSIHSRLPTQPWDPENLAAEISKTKSGKAKLSTISAEVLRDGLNVLDIFPGCPYTALNGLRRIGRTYPHARR